ncbi:protocadherin-17 [Patagioenas fasciata monilis]|uniref:Protocadherin-17 n=1 Tax=Patagioenas fasciata monilis TaxID=372326 RepID=A0A1V4J4B7_PATFA|nr:protocadherin-17 [Patagioenas fasciata monilis]
MLPAERGAPGGGPGGGRGPKSTFRQRIDREALCRRNTKCQLSLEVFANDQEICMIKVEIQDLNDNAPAAHDPDAGDNGLRTYLLTRDDYGLFSLDVKSRGDGTKFPELVIQKPLDREEQSHHTLINVRLIDSNDNSPVFEAASYVGTNGESGLIRVKGNLDYEESGLIEIDVQARDLGPNPIPAHCKGALSEAAPPGTVIALVRVTDLVTDRPLDREAQDEYNVTIVARDGGNPPLNSTKSFSVRILDENDNPPRFSKNLYVLQVPENNIPGEYLGSVLAQDPDLGQNGTVSYSILPGHVGDVSIYTYVSVNPTNGAIYALRSFNYEQTKHFEFRVLAKDSGSPHRESNATVRVTVLDVNDNAPLIVLPALINDTAELQVPRNAGVGYPVGTVRALDSDFGESGRLTYEIVEGNEEHLFEMDPTSGEIRTLHPYWEELSPVAELVVKVSDHGKPSLSAVAKLIVRALAGPLPEAGEPQVNGEQHRRPHWDLSLPLIVTLSTVSIILLAAMITIAVKCKRENKEIRTYNCRIAEYSHPQLGGGGGSGGGGGGSGSGGGKGKKKKISKNDIMLVPSEGEDSRGPLNVMNVVSSPSLATSPMYFDYQTRLPLSSPRSEVMYLKPASNNLTVPQGHVGCHTSFTGQGTNASEAPPSRMSIIQTDNFPAEPNYMGSRQQFVQREALKMKTTSAKSQPLEQEQQGRGQRPIVGICGPARCEDGKFSEQEECVNCTDECRVLGHSDRCWMPQFPAASQAENADYRTNLFVPTVEANVETETYETVNPTGKKTFCTFGKDKREHTILIANVKPYLKAKRALSPLLQEVPSASSSPTKTCIEPCTSTKGPLDGCEVKSGALAEPNSQYLSTDSQYLSPSKQSKDAPFIATDQMARAFADAHSRVSRDSSEMDSVLEQLDRSARDLGRESVDAEEVVREIDKLLQDCRGSDPVAVRK